MTLEDLETVSARRAPLMSPAVKRFMNFRILVGGGLLLALAFCAAFAPMLAPFPPMEMDLLNSLSFPVWALGPDAMPGAETHLLGTDSLGRDVLSNLLYGTRVALYVAFVAAF